MGWAAASGGGGGSTGRRYPVQEQSAAAANSSSVALTLASSPTNGNLMIALIESEGAKNVNSITQTNVTWTKLAESTASTSPHAEIWIGAVAASAGTGITVAYSAGGYCGFHVSEWSGLSGTLDQSASVAAQTAVSSLSFNVPTITPTSASALVVVVAAQSGWGADFQAIDGPDWMRFRSPVIGSNSTSYGVAFAFPEGQPVVGMLRNSHTGTTFSCVVASIT